MGARTSEARTERKASKILTPHFNFMTKKKKHIPNPKGRPRGRFVNTEKKEKTVTMRVKESKVDLVKEINKQP